MMNRHSATRGFTLIEVVIALTLMSLIMLGLLSAFATLGNTATRLDEHAGKSGQQWLMMEFLRATLVSATGQLKQPLDSGGQTIYFRGGPQTLQWLGSMPARYGAGGLYRFALEIESVGTETRLVIRYAPYVKDVEPDASTLDSHVLAENVSSLRISYLNKPTRPDEEAVWGETWEDTEKLPGRIRIDLFAEAAAWPPLVVAMGGADTAVRSTSSGTPVLGPVRPKP